jgi:hypothetical protein
LADCGIVKFGTVLTPLMVAEDNKEDKKVGSMDNSSDKQIRATVF